jgi:hypothetical protein
VIVPRHWAEARLQERSRGRQITVRRHGWSNISLDDAQRNAEARAREALERIRNGERLARREQKVPYNGADGLPIREEIIAEHGHVVITRNSYGAQCLNTPDVLIADVDFVPTGTDPFALSVGAALAVAGVALGRLGLDSWGLGTLFALVGAAFGETLAKRIRAMRAAAHGGPLAHALARVRAFVVENPTWHIRAYETPNGLRLIVLQQLFDPLSREVAHFFDAVGVDRQYAFMCTRQRCFRARLTAKPWRIGIETHMKPRPGVWPVREERRAERTAWLAAYDDQASRFAACRFVTALGDATRAHQGAVRVATLHDALARAESELEIA